VQASPRPQLNEGLLGERFSLVTCGFLCFGLNKRLCCRRNSTMVSAMSAGFDSLSIATVIFTTPTRTPGPTVSAARDWLDATEAAITSAPAEGTARSETVVDRHCHVVHLEQLRG
jgi:hypothetical protein